jgi:hypothetical protein
VAKEKCDDLAGNAKDVCVKEAKAVRVSAKADAKASEKSADARSEAAADKIEAQYKVEKEKCDKFAGNAKDNCVAQAKAQLSK